MKRYGNLYDRLCWINNIELADDKARKHKSSAWGVRKHDKKRVEENLELLKLLVNLTYETSAYTTFTIYEPKERIIFRLPYFPDRICHHTIMNITEPIWVKTFISNTYSCIKNRGIMALFKDLKKALTNKEETAYCLKLDITKFYPSIDNNILKQVIRRKIKDLKLLQLLDSIIDSSKGVPIGNYLSLFFANLYISYLDHWLKEEVGCKYYFRYADDIVILSNDKEFLHKVLVLIKLYLSNILNLKIKGNYRVFPVSLGIDFVGYKFYHTHILLRKSIKLKIKKLLHKYSLNKIDIEYLKIHMSSYYGWLKVCNSKHFLLYIEAATNLHLSNWNGKHVNISNCYKLNVKVYGIVYHNKYTEIHFIHKHMPYVTYSKSKNLKKCLMEHQDKIFNFYFKK